MECDDDKEGNFTKRVRTQAPQQRSISSTKHSDCIWNAQYNHIDYYNEWIKEWMVMGDICDIMNVNQTEI